jgi:hypothetical protein
MLRRYNERDRARFEAARSVDELPRWFSWLTPPRPALSDDENILFDFPAIRLSESSLAWWRSRYTNGRLTITTQRIAYRESKSRFFLRKFVPEAGDIDIPFSEVMSVAELPWRTRALWEMSGLPGMVMLEVRRVGPTVVRFGNVQKHYWELAKDDVSLHCSVA